MMNACWCTSVRDTFSAQIAQLGGSGDIVPVPIMPFDLPWTIHEHFDSPGTHWVSVLLFAGNLARATSRTILVIDQKTIASHLAHLSLSDIEGILIDAVEVVVIDEWPLPFLLDSIMISAC